MSKPVADRSHAQMIAAATKRLRVAERNAAARYAARQIVYVPAPAATTLASGSWSDHAVLTINPAIPCRLRLSASCYFASTGAGNVEAAAGLFVGLASTATVALVASLQSLQGSTVTVQPVVNGTAHLTYELDVLPGLQTFTLGVTKFGATGVGIAQKVWAVGGVSTDGGWIQATIL